MTEEVSGKFTPELISALRERATESLFFFAKGILGFDRLDPKIHGPICKILEDEKLRKNVKITLPRGWYKTTICSQAYPIWRAIRDPNIRVLLVQNTITNAISKLGVIEKQISSNPLLRALFPEILPDANCIWKSDKLELKRTQARAEATFEAAGTRSSTVSRHYDIIIEDDTVAPELDQLGEENVAPSKEDIEKAIGFHRYMLPPLFDDVSTGENLVVGTRWFEKDLLSWMSDKESYYTSYSRAVRESTLTGLPDESGIISFPERFPADVLEKLEAKMGKYMFSCLYMNEPLRSSDMIFQMDWINYYDELPASVLHYTSVDPAGDPEDTIGKPDFNVVATCAKDLLTGRVYLVDYFRARCSQSALLDALFRHIELYKPVKAVIEAVAYQKSLLSHIRERMRAAGKYVMIEPETWGRKSKNQRILGLQPLMMNRQLLVKTHHQEFISEALSFPLGANDDVIDCVSMQLRVWALSKLKRGQHQDKLDDPFSVETTMEEIRGMHKQKHQFENLTPYRPLGERVRLPNGVFEYV